MFNVKDLNVAYGQSRVIKDISFSAAKGETVAVLGRNGMGKTTLMKSAIGLLNAQSGSININGTDVTKKRTWERVASGMAFVPQGRAIFSLMTVEENLKTGLETVRPRKIDETLYETFPVLKEMRKRKGGNLSGGQQQQLAIARALSSKPKVLLLDEPAEGIQPSIVKDIARVLNQIKKIHELTIVISEQLLSFALEVADRLLVIESGQIVLEEHRATVNEARIHKYLAV